MSRLKHYLDLLKRGIPNSDKIIEGLLNQVKMETGLINEDENREILRRRLICEECPLFSLNAKKDPKPYEDLLKKPLEIYDKEGGYCTICGCPYKTRTASLSAKCGLDYYNQNNKNNIQKLKWDEYNGTNKINTKEDNATKDTDEGIVHE